MPTLSPGTVQLPRHDLDRGLDGRHVRIAIRETSGTEDAQLVAELEPACRSAGDIRHDRAPIEVVECATADDACLRRDDKGGSVVVVVSTIGAAVECADGRERVALKTRQRWRGREADG